MPLASLRRHVRRSAALLAWVAILAMPVQGVLACPMPEPATSVAPDDAHAAHHGSAPAERSEAADGEENRGSGEPSVPPCRDLAHCAVAAVPRADEAGGERRPVPTRVGAADSEVPPAPAPSLEPPPPKR